MKKNYYLCTNNETEGRKRLTATRPTTAKNDITNK